MLRWSVAVLAAVVLVGFTAPGAAALPRGEGTLLIMQNPRCAQHGESSSVYYAFAGLFTGFEPNTTGTVTAYTQPGGVQVGHRSVTVDARGNRCELVTGTAPPGQYKFVYDFGSGTGKQKVVRIVEAPAPTPSESPSESPSVPSESPSSSVPSQSSTVPSQSATTSTSSSASSSPSKGSPTASGSGAPGQSASPSSSAAASPGTSVQGEQIIFTPLDDSVGDAAMLASTGGNMTALLGVAAVLLASGTALLSLGRRREGRR